MKEVTRFLMLAALAINVYVSVKSQQPDPPGQVLTGRAVHEAYLFAHMMHNDYGKLYYTVSLDGLHWEILNGGKRVFEDYRGHPDICRGHDGRYYIVGNKNDAAPDINIWVSDDLINWEHHIDMLEEHISGNLYKTVLFETGKDLFYSVTRINELICTVILWGWIAAGTYHTIKFAALHLPDGNAFHNLDYGPSVLLGHAILIIILIALPTLCLSVIKRHKPKSRECD